MARKNRGNNKGDRALERLKEGLKKMPLSVAHSVAKLASPEMTGLTRRSFATGRTVYGDPRPMGSARVKGAGPVQGPMPMVERNRGKYMAQARKRAKKPEYLRVSTGKPLDLVKTGRTRADLAFATLGTVVRVVLAAPYQKYLIGKYKILPIQVIPVAWDKSLDRIAQAELSRYTAEVIK
jgi:hypothetical protein